MNDILKDIAATLAKQGAPVLGGLIGSAIGGPAGGVIGGMAGKGLEALANALGTSPEPAAVKEALSKPEAAPAVVQAENTAMQMLPIWQAELAMRAEAQSAEIKNGFTAWQFMRIAIQAVVWGGWTVILAVALFGGNLAAKPTMGVADVVTAWGGVTWVWMLVFHGGHTLKEVAPSIMSAFTRGAK